MRELTAVACVVLLASCGRSAHPVQAASIQPFQDVQPVVRQIRLTGVLEAKRSSKIAIPAMYGQQGPVTLVWLIHNGARVQKSDLLAKFDPTQQLDSARAAQASYEDFSHQVDQAVAQNRANLEQRELSLQQAEAARDKALLELRKGPILSEISRLENQVRADIAREQVDSLKKSTAARNRGDVASLRYLELRRDRQKVTLERWRDSIAKLEMHAPLAGMVALQNIYRNNALVHAEEGDQLYRGQALLSIFDPSVMLVRCSVGEPDGAALAPGMRAKVYLDAYPDLVIPAHFEFVSPVAAGTLGSPIKSFTAIFRLDKPDPRLMPDLSAAVVLEPPVPAGGDR